jgi:hypothetical protein
MNFFLVSFLKVFVLFDLWFASLAPLVVGIQPLTLGDAHQVDDFVVLDEVLFEPLQILRLGDWVSRCLVLDVARGLVCVVQIAMETVSQLVAVGPVLFVVFESIVFAKAP